MRGTTLTQVTGRVLLSLGLCGVVPGTAEAFGFEGRPKWSGKERPILFLINMAHVPPAYPEEQYVGLIKEALEPWTQVETAEVPFRISPTVMRDETVQQPQADGVNMVLWNTGAVPREVMSWGRAFAFAEECDIVVELTTPFIRADVVHTLRHEFGHCFGLAHSTVMSIMAKYSHYLPVLTHDDIVGISVLFPKAQRPLSASTSTLKGRVVRYNGDAVVGAVVSVISGDTQQVVLGGFSGLVDQQQRLDRSGRFELPGVPPGRHRLVIQPMATFGGIMDGHHGAPIDDPPSFRSLTVELPELDAGDSRDLGKIIVED